MEREKVLNNLAVWHNVATGEERKEIIEDEYWMRFTEESLQGKLLLIDEEFEDLRSIDNTDEAVLKFISEENERYIKRCESVAYKNGQENLQKALQMLLGLDVSRFKIIED